MPERPQSAALCGLLLTLATLGPVACSDSGSSQPTVGVPAPFDLLSPVAGSDAGRDAESLGPADMADGNADLLISSPPEGNPLLNGITAEHNKARAAVTPVPAIPLPPLTWNTTVAATAQAWANNCMFMHSVSNPYGENLFASKDGATPADVVNAWVSEKSDYNYNANTCSTGCGHYTQVVWRSTARLGCGVKNCTTGSPFGGGPWQLWVCDYDPPGSFNQRPY